MIKSCNVDRVFKLEQRWPDASSASTKVYFVSPTLANAKIILDHLNMSNNIQKGLIFHVIFMPKLLKEVDIFLEEEGAHGKLTIHEYLWEMIPLDYDLLSLELNQFFERTFKDEEYSLLHSVSQSILGIQALFGQVKNRVGIGKHSVTVLEQLDLLEHGQHTSSGTSREISTLIVVDRSLDYASALLSPLTYEALLNEVFVNTCGTIDLDERVTKGEHVKLQLSSRDKMFAKIRAQHFTNIFASLSSYAKQLKQQQAKAANMSINEMKSFVQKELKDMQTQGKAVALHIGACEVIQKEQGPIYEYTLPLEHGIVQGGVCKETLAYLEEAMAQLKSKSMVLRLMCLLSLCNNGISSGDYEKLKHQFLQAYGFDKLMTFNILKKLGLNAAQNQSVVASSQMQEDVLYVFNGSYIPLLCKITKDVLTSRSALDEDLKELKVKHKIQIANDPSSAQSNNAGKVVLIYFVGGYTFSEVAAFRHLQTILGNQFIIAGTSSISGKTMMDEVL